MNSPEIWRVGQRAVIDRTSVVTIERVTPSGRAITKDRTFDRDGHERSNAAPHRRSRLEPLTPEIEAEMALVQRSRRVRRDAFAAIEAADKWLRSAFPSWANGASDVADVEQAERLTAAILGVMNREGEP